MFLPLSQQRAQEKAKERLKKDNLKQKQKAKDDEALEFKPVAGSFH